MTPRRSSASSLPLCTQTSRALGLSKLARPCLLVLPSKERGPAGLDMLEEAAHLQAAMKPGSRGEDSHLKTTKRVSSSKP